MYDFTVTELAEQLSELLLSSELTGQLTQTNETLEAVSLQIAELNEQIFLLSSKADIFLAIAIALIGFMIFRSLYYYLSGFF